MVTAEPAGHEPPDFLTDEWVGWLDSVLSQCPVDSEVELVLEHCVTDRDGSAFCWHVRVAEGRVSAAAGPAAERLGAGLVVFTSDRETARAIAADGKSAQRAFAEGRLNLEGDALQLIAVRPVMEAIGAALARSAQAPT